MIDFIKMIHVPLEGLIGFLVVFFLVKYLILKYLPFEDLEIEKSLIKKIFNWILFIVILFFTIYLVKFAVMTEVPKSKIENTEYIDNGQTRFEQNCKNTLDTTKNKK